MRPTTCWWPPTDPTGSSLYAVDAAAAGVERTPLATLDLTRPQATVRFSDAPGPADRRRERGRAGHRARPAGRIGVAGRRTGRRRAASARHLAVEYAKSRLQFGRPIGSFQAVKHRLADVLVDVEHARSTAYHAVWASTDGSDDPALAAQHRAGHVLGGVQPGRDRHHPGARRHRVHVGTPGAPVLQACRHRRRAAGHAPSSIGPGWPTLVLDTAEAERVPAVATGAPS